MRSGDLNRRLQIQTRSTGQDTTGGQSEVWTTVATVWAKIEPLSGRELLAAQSVKSEVTHNLKIRYQSMFADPAAVAAMRGLYKGRIFNFHASRNVEERNRDIEIQASEGMNNG